ncbi:glycoside hydrolase family 76 protein [Microlunatus soli]|nr:glycoside hydrolase family 76 protein [Microlunatus soli]
MPTFLPPARLTRAVLTSVAGLLSTGLIWSATPAHAVPDQPATPAASAATWANRATDAYRALQRELYQGADDHGLYLERTPKQDADRDHSYLWPMREAAAAAVDMSRLPRRGAAYRDDAAERFDTIELYFGDGERPGYQSYLPAPLGTGGDVYYDDNAVVGLSELDQYELTGSPIYLKRAEQIVPIVSRAWDTDDSLTCPGGMDWYDSPNNVYRATNVTALSAQLAARLYERTRNADYLAKAEQWYGWVYTCMRQAPGLYDNDRNDDGSTNPTLWSYNSGAMIGTATSLFRSTGDRSYLANAVEDARSSLAYWTQGTRLHDQPAIFNAFYFKDLLELDAIRGNRDFLIAMSDYAAATYASNRDPATGLYRFQPSGGGDYDPDAPAETLEQSAMIQIFATLAVATPH